MHFQVFDIYDLLCMIIIREVFCEANRKLLFEHFYFFPVSCWCDTSPRTCIIATSPQISTWTFVVHIKSYKVTSLTPLSVLRRISCDYIATYCILNIGNIIYLSLQKIVKSAAFWWTKKLLSFKLNIHKIRNS